MVVSPLGRLAAIPVIARIHDGIVYSNRSQQSVIHRFTGLIDKITTDAERQAIIVADAYYTVKTMISEAAKIGFVLVSIVQHNCAAHYPALPPKVKKRGRPTKKGVKIKFKSFFKKFDKIAISYGDNSYYIRHG